MISFVVCLYREELYASVCEPRLHEQVAMHGAEIILVESDRGICEAYEIGRKEAAFPTVCYLHDDLELLTPAPQILKLMDDTGAQLLGAVGSALGDLRCPWWAADKHRGGWRQPSDHHGLLRFYKGTEGPAQLLDGIILVDRSNLPWPDFPGWHGYDVDRCMSVHQAGGKVYAGGLDVIHHNQPHDESWTRAINPTMVAMRKKWGLEK